ncbi:MAG: adenylate/guanylate cyclase domain-containing protein [Afipia sp.]|nr:adenylate/guanylate cyclase domain-containing protein [Afipia sp.]
MAETFQSVAGWLTNGARSAQQVDLFMAETCERIAACGVPLCRVGVFVRTLHPSMLGRNFIWRPGEAVKIGAMAHGDELDEEFLLSPLYKVFYGGETVRQRMTNGAASNAPFFADMVAEGATDYIAFPLEMSDGAIHACSWVTRAKDGFSDAHVEGLRSVMPSLTRMIEIFLLRRTAAGLLDNYVGARAGSRILAGQIRRGHTETMNAAIWLSDLRGFTKLSDRLSSETVVNILNAYFDCQVPAILAHGGEVLKFMGDGLLSVFPIADDAEDADLVCRRMLEAAQECRAQIAALSHDTGTETVDGFRFGLALHVGRVLYGNIGGGDRLDFTCIGPAVNLAARIEKIAGSLGRSVVASSLFNTYAGVPLTDLGEFAVAGFSAPQRVYGLPDEASVPKAATQH